MNLAIITPAEADVILAQYPDWLALDEPTKTYHIERASVYCQTQWTCIDVEWDETINIPAEIKTATAYYAYADSTGNLYGDVTEEDVPTGNLRTVKERVGDLESEVGYFLYGGGSSAVAGSLGYPNTLMQVHCESVGSSVIQLERN